MRFLPNLNYFYIVFSDSIVFGGDIIRRVVDGEDTLYYKIHSSYSWSWEDSLVILKGGFHRYSFIISHKH